MGQKIFVALLVFVISTPSGYWLNSYLSRERLSVEYAQIEPTLNTYRINTELFARIQAFRFSNYFSGGGISFQPLGSELTSDEVAALIVDLSSQKASALVQLENIESDLELLKSIAPDSQELAVFIATKTPHINFRYGDDSGLSKEAVLKVVKDSRDDIAEYIRNIDTLNASLRGFERARSGDFVVVVTVLNAGNTDGLVAKEGGLKSAQYSELGSIPIRVANKTVQELRPRGLFYGFPEQLSAGGDTKIEKRSMSELTFKINRERAGTKMVDELEDTVRDGRPIDFTVELKDFRGQILPTKQFKLYATD